MTQFQLVIPCFNEADSLPQLMANVVRAAEQEGYSPDQFKAVVVDNGSSDATQEVLEKLCQGALGRYLEIARLPVNKGYGFGVMSGLLSTTAEFIGYTHGDLQCNPLDALRALKRIQKRTSVVKGSRYGRALREQLFSRVFETMVRILLRLNVDEINAQPKVFHRSLLAELKNPPNHFGFDLYLLYCAVRAGFEIQTIPVLFPPRAHGFSHWANGWKQRWRTIAAMMAYIWNLRRQEGTL